MISKGTNTYYDGLSDTDPIGRALRNIKAGNYKTLLTSFSCFQFNTIGPSKAAHATRKIFKSGM